MTLNSAELPIEDIDVILSRIVRIRAHLQCIFRAESTLNPMVWALQIILYNETRTCIEEIICEIHGVRTKYVVNTRTHEICGTKPDARYSTNKEKIDCLRAKGMARVWRGPWDGCLWTLYRLAQLTSQLKTWMWHLEDGYNPFNSECRTGMGFNLEKHTNIIWAL